MNEQKGSQEAKMTRQILSFLCLLLTVSVSAGTRIKPRLVLLHDTLRLECNGTLETVDVESGSLELPRSDDKWGLWRLEIRPPAKTQGFHDAWKLLQGSNADSLRVVLGKDSLTLVNGSRAEGSPTCPENSQRQLGILEIPLEADSFKVYRNGKDPMFGAELWNLEYPMVGWENLRKCGVDQVIPLNNNPDSVGQRECMELALKQDARRNGVEYSSDYDRFLLLRMLHLSTRQFRTRRNSPLCLISQPQTSASLTLSHLRRLIPLLTERMTPCERDAWWNRMEWVQPEELEPYQGKRMGFGPSVYERAKRLARKTRVSMRPVELADFSMEGDTGSRPLASVQRVLRIHQGGMRYSYEKALSEHPGLVGTVTLRLVISPSGEVVAATLETPEPDSPALNDALLSKARRMRFDAIEKGTVTVHWTLRMVIDPVRPGEGPKGARSCKELR